MRLRPCLLATVLVAGPVTAAMAQDPEPRPDRRSRIWIEPHHRRPLTDFYQFRMTPDRMRTLERSLEHAERVRRQALERSRLHLDRAERVRDRLRDHSIERANRVRDREFVMRDRISERVQSSLRRSLEVRERAMERVRERLDQVRDQHFFSRRRWRTI